MNRWKQLTLALVFVLAFLMMVAPGTAKDMGSPVSSASIERVRVVPNGELTQFANYNRGWARAVIDVGVGHRAGGERLVTAAELDALPSELEKLDISLNEREREEAALGGHRHPVAAGPRVGRHARTSDSRRSSAASGRR